MNVEEANYIITWYSNLLTLNELSALKHHRHSLKLEAMPDAESRSRLYKKINWLTDDPEVLSNLDQGYNAFIVKCAERILNENPGLSNLNLCPNCGKLARTPLAKQCRFCGWDWH